MLLLVLLALLLSREPAVEQQRRPTAQGIDAARGAVRQLRDARGARQTAEVRLDNRMLEGLSALAGDASGYDRVEAEIASGTLAVRASLPLPAGFWLNGAATTSGASDGFPDLKLSAGHITLPAFASRWAVEAARWLLLMRGATVPPLDRIVERVEVGPQHLVARVRLPSKMGVMDGLTGARSEPIDAEAVERLYCRIAAVQRSGPISLAPLVRRAFGEAPAGDTDHARAAFVALAFILVPDRAAMIAPGAARRTQTCPRSALSTTLLGRDDLAKHWAVSAALTATLGDQAADAVGEWKELSDSLPAGSGFSFVDLAADRAGVHAARRAVDPATARQAAAELARAGEEQLLPVRLLAEKEGLSEADFVSGYGRIDEASYRAAVARIDRELGRAPR